MPPITRKAFIVGAESIAGETRVLGVRVDKSRIFQFLLSDEGGAWSPGEIEVLEKPLLQMSEAPAWQFDYQVTYFAGHGFSEAGVPYVCLNDQQFVPVSALPRQASRSLVIIDACRNEIRDRPPLVVKTAEFAGIGGLSDLGARLRCRWLYDAAISAAEPGFTHLFASSYNETASGTPHEGGYFTRHLVEGARTWAGLPRSGQPEVLSVATAFRIASARIPRGTQSPAGYTEQAVQHLPFAVRPW